MAMVRTIVAAGVLAASLALAPVGAGAQAEPTGPATLADVLGGRIDGVDATASGGFDGGDTLDVTLDVVNGTDEPITFVVPRGALFESDDPAHQTAVTRGPADEDPGLAELGVDPTVTIEPGRHELALAGYCAQASDAGPDEVVPMTFAGVAEAPLPRILHNIVVEEPSDELAQEAVWWATDRPVAGVRPELLALLEGVDVAGFAAEPQRVVLDERYTPEWRRTELGAVPGADPIGDPGVRGGGGSAGAAAGAALVGSLLVGLLTVLTIGVVAAVAVARGGRRPVPVRTGTSPAGWYPDPGDGRYVRFWNGTRWTGEVRSR